MKHFLFSFLLSLCIIPFSGLSQTKVGDVYFPSIMAAKAQKLILNGGGTREKYFMDLYVAVLYLVNKSDDAKKVTNADEPMSIRIHIVSSLITSEKMSGAVDEGFKKSTGGNTAPFTETINEFKAVFMEKISKGDKFDIIYIPNEGVNIYKNEKHKALIPGLEFKKALFGIWLGDDPADSNLKEGMLGKK